MLTALLFVAICAEPEAKATEEVPKNFIAYFEREAKHKKQLIEDNERRRSQLNAAYSSATNRNKPRIKSQIEDAKEEGERLRKLPALAPMSISPSVDDVGEIAAIRVTDILQGSVFIVSASPKLKAVVLTDDPGRFKGRESETFAGMFVVKGMDGMSVPGVGDVVEKGIRLGAKYPKEIPVLVKVEPARLEELRAAYESQKKQAK